MFLTKKNSLQHLSQESAIMSKLMRTKNQAEGHVR